MRRAAQACGCELQVFDQILDLPDSDPNVKALVVEPSAVTTDEQQNYLQKLSSVYNTMLLNEKFDSTVVELLRGDLCNHAIDIARLNIDQLIITMNKLLSGDIFGVEKYLPWGVPIQSIEVTSYEQKREAMEHIIAFVRRLGCRAPLITRIETAVEELLMNALYDAPIAPDEDRNKVLQNMLDGGSARDPVQIRYASGGKEFIVSVTDVYGRLSKGTIIERLGADHVSQINERSGAGLYLLLSKAARVIVNVAPGLCTEVISFFDLDWPVTYQGVRSFQYFQGPEKKP